MPKNCPDCGAAVEFSPTEGPVTVGRCEACGKSFAVLDGLSGLLSGGLVVSEHTTPAPDEEEETDEDETEAAGEGPGLSCETCGGNLMLAADEERNLRATCDSCGATTQYVVAGAPPAPERKGGWRTDRPPRDFGDERPRARPCRECGAPIRLTTAEDGTVSGECTSCGNRFVLGPRRSGGGDRRGFRGPPRGGFNRGRSSYGRPPGRRPSYGRREGGRGDDDDRRPRRRRDRDE